MSELWSYSLSDFQLFSLRVYYRLFELHNNALWPVQVLTIGLGLAMFYLVARPTPARSRMIFAILGALWLWIAWSFFWERYATINWLATYIAPFAAMQGYLLLRAGAMTSLPDFAEPRQGWDAAAHGLLAFAVVGYPFIALAMGRPWSAVEVFGITPDPTAIATVAVVALARGRIRWLLMLIPGLWCVMTGLTLWTMEANEFFVAPVCALTAGVIALERVRR